MKTYQDEKIPKKDKKPKRNGRMMPIHKNGMEENSSHVVGMEDTSQANVKKDRQFLDRSLRRNKFTFSFFSSKPKESSTWNERNIK